MSYEIISGPSLDELLDSFRHAYDGGACEPVKFEAVFDYNHDGEPLLVQMSDTNILAIEYEDGSGKGLNVRGRCLVNLNPHSARKPDETRLFRGYYSLDTGHGWITFL